MRIAIVKLSALGDIIHAMIVLQYIKENSPNTQIDWFVEAKFKAILENNPHIHRIYPLHLKHNALHFFTEYQNLKKIAHENKYDLIIDLQGLLKSAIVARILGKQCIGFDKHSLREPIAARLYHRCYTIDYRENVIIRNLKLVSKALNMKLPNIDHKKPFLYPSAPIDIFPDLLIIVGSSWPSKIYPKEHFVTLLNALHVKSYIAWGNEQEKHDAQFICSHTHASLLPSLNLNELKAVVQNSALVIGGDSGPTHMAWALNRPSITIFGPTPRERNTVTTAINITIGCAKAIDAKHINKNDMCIKDIDPATLIKYAKELLAC